MPENTAYTAQYQQFEAPQRDTVRKVFYQGCPGTSDTLLYTSPNLPGARSEVLQIIIANTDSSARTLWMHMVPKGGSNAVSNALFYEVSFAAHTTTIESDSIAATATALKFMKLQARTVTASPTRKKARVPFVVLITNRFPATFSLENSRGEFPRSNPSIMSPRASPHKMVSSRPREDANFIASSVDAAG